MPGREVNVDVRLLADLAQRIDALTVKLTVLADTLSFGSLALVFFVGMLAGLVFFLVFHQCRR